MDSYWRDGGGATARDDLIARFWTRVKKTETCWLWMGPRDQDGYGLYSVAHARVVRAHRFAYETSHHEPLGTRVCAHRCDMPACVRPEHLFAATPAENSGDMVRKGRSARGVRNPAARLSQEQAAAVLHRVRAGEAKRALAREYSVSDTAIRLIVKGKSWRYLDREAGHGV